MFLHTTCGWGCSSTTVEDYDVDVTWIFFRDISAQQAAAAWAMMTLGLGARDRPGYRGVLDDVADRLEQPVATAGLEHWPADVRRYIENAREQGRGSR